MATKKLSKRTCSRESAQAAMDSSYYYVLTEIHIYYKIVNYNIAYYDLNAVI